MFARVMVASETVSSQRTGRISCAAWRPWRQCGRRANSCGSLHPIPDSMNWRNTKHLGQAVASRRREGLDCSPNLLAHISPLGWTHILLTKRPKPRAKDESDGAGSMMTTNRKPRKSCMNHETSSSSDIARLVRLRTMMFSSARHPCMIPSNTSCTRAQ